MVGWLFTLIDDHLVQETDPPMEEDPLGALDPAPSMHQG